MFGCESCKSTEAEIYEITSADELFVGLWTKIYIFQLHIKTFKPDLNYFIKEILSKISRCQARKLHYRVHYFFTILRLHQYLRELQIGK